MNPDKYAAKADFLRELNLPEIPAGVDRSLRRARRHGLMCALELVADRGTKAPIDKTVIGKVHRVTYEAGVMVRVSGNNIILSPPLVVTEADVAKILSALEAGFAAI